MKVVVISGSPRKNGNCEKMARDSLEEISKNGIEGVFVSLAELNILPCNACEQCSKEKKCPIDDDMRGVYEILESADGIVVISPVYFGGVSSQLKALFDRTLLLRKNGLLLKNKVGGAGAVGRSRNGGQELTIQGIHAWMHIHGMVIVGDDNHFGATVQHPYEEDEFGRQTLIRMVRKVCEVVNANVKAKS